MLVVLEVRDNGLTTPKVTPVRQIRSLLAERVNGIIMSLLLAQPRLTRSLGL
jgi:hypothetical protein